MYRALQDAVKVHCYGCGALNEHGLQIKSYWAGDDVVCAWRPQPHHIGYPGLLYGGLIAAVIDCHCIWTASAYAHRAAGVELDGALRFSYVTAALNVNYRKPVPIGDAVDLRARVREFSERKALVECRVSCRGELCAEADVIAVLIRSAHAARAV
ncbi:MAG TPA: PaaI family thioesterase [Burkholderiales bacterium]|nr:PaaI family thioesterase [Burkholderiales bacterium]